MSISAISSSGNAASSVPTLVATQQEAIKEAQTNVQDGDENLGATIDANA
ncbi:MAG: hypothetical protein KGN02_01800 [bacterium]|nr:hypothetical protein [bacterium]